MNRKLILFGALAAVTFLLVILFSQGGVLIPNRIQGDVLRVNLLGIMASDTGANATFKLFNDNGPKVDVHFASVLQSDGVREVVPLQLVTLDKNEKVTLDVPVPSEGKWQVSFHVKRHRKEQWRYGTVVESEWIVTNAAGQGDSVSSHSGQ